MHPLADIAADRGLPNPYGDAALLMEYQDAGHDPADVVYLSLGETWTQAAPGLRDILASALPAYCHGYVLSPYGLPELQRALRAYIRADHSLADTAALGTDYDVCVSQNSTRNAMFHFGRWLRETTPAAVTAPPVAVCSTPAWDYSGVYTALGYEMRHFSLAPETGYQPDPQEVAQVLRRARRDSDGPLLLILNAQHNPTGANWAPDTVRAMIRAAVETGADLLVDDAFYAVYDPGITPTNTLRILLEEVGGLPPARRPRWLAVRSLGKQYHCNGWGIGALTAAPGTLTQLFTRLLPQYTYVSAVPLQAAMARWLRSPASDAYLAREREEYAAKRAEVAGRLTDGLGYPEGAFFPGESGPFLLARIPPWYAESAAPGAREDFRRYCLYRCGVLLGEGHMSTPGLPVNDSRGYVRLYLGAPLPSLVEALERMRAAGLAWEEERARCRAAVA
ncbi:pyridoxal phosphate-dependent aminotransferase [Streptomyces fumanus]|uniref:pyridoxal phosphate-dependent aminotransferase n=1 Tax=Streptomyces fumanus TaxID=67302 RepID=UPI003408473D